MNWHELLQQQINEAYTVAERLLKLLDEEDLSWKPSQENNWMTTGQLLLHLGKSCGLPIKGFATGEWEIPDHSELGEAKPAPTLPPTATGAQPHEA